MFVETAIQFSRRLRIPRLFDQCRQWLRTGRRLELIMAIEYSCGLRIC